MYFPRDVWKKAQQKNSLLHYRRMRPKGAVSNDEYDLFVLYNNPGCPGWPTRLDIPTNKYNQARPARGVREVPWVLYPMCANISIPVPAG